MPQNRPSVKAGILRTVRQRCGFGCVICGKPIFEYEHMLGWANVRRHVASEITLLCDDHHRAKTGGFIPAELVVAADKDPINLKTGVTRSYPLIYYGTQYVIGIGSCSFEKTDGQLSALNQIIRIDGEPLLWVRLEDGHILLNLRVYNSKGGIALEIVDNELVANVNSWDIEVVGTQFTIREGKGNILFDLLFTPPSSIHVRRGRFLRNGIELLITPRWAALLNTCTLFHRLAMSSCTAGFVFGDDPHPPFGIFNIANIPRNGWDRNSSVAWARQTAAHVAAMRRIVDELIDADSLN
jgi:hypothetical protein